ncbi:MAG: DNA gyrase subunit A [Actinomycetota bacterium]
MKDATGLSLLDLVILSACEDEDALPLAPFRKTARILQRVHTNTSIGPAVAHEPLLDLCRPWVVHLPLIEGQGNIGSPDDPPANPRYTESRLTPLGVAALNVERDQLGPLPIALINGTMLSGGPHPPHDPGRVVAAIRAAIDDASDAELVELVGPPAFPTGCVVDVDQEALAAGATVELRQRAQFVHLGDQLMVTGLPLRTGPDVIADRLHGRLRTAAHDAGVNGLDQPNLTDLIVELRPGTDPSAAIAVLSGIWDLNRTDHVRLREPMADAIRRIADGGRDLDHRLALIDDAIRP